MRLDFRFSGRPPDSLWCEAVVVFVFQRKFLTLGLLSGLDAKMGGLLGRLENAGFWTGTFQEDLLLASQGRIRAEKVLLCGLGPSTGCEFPCIAAEVERAGEVLAKMHVSDLAVHIPMLEGEEADYPNHLVQSAERLSAPFLQTHRESSDFLLKVVFSMERFHSTPLSQAADRLRDRFRREFDVSVLVEGDKHPD
jgi:hypothetical protein